MTVVNMQKKSIHYTSVFALHAEVSKLGCVDLEQNPCGCLVTGFLLATKASQDANAAAVTPSMP